MRFTNKTDIFFDLDHTLWDFERNSALTFKKIFAEHNVAVDVEAFLKHYVPVNMKYWALYREDKIDHMTLRYKRLKDVFDLVPFEVKDEVIHLISEEYIKYLPTFNHLFDGAIDVLEYLKPKYNLHIITNGFQEVQNGKLRNANIEHYFDTVTNSEMAGVKKPHPRIFEYALELAKAEKANSLMVGDSLEADMEGAKSIGLDALFFNEAKIEEPHDFPQIYHLSELKNLL
ncbi:putative haloacid dehalogenase-like hydrolase [Flavobacterium limnosediminis JC2902]|uniref:Putative haloacid dehalogenase-like hydrolase n=1 Tax=Flavobacterium limnosediminis JC2902 TaxID=1341181 RepID=V6SL59_9FLAO|nr:YjjG family noncanonical pyrimidine nucleotidase [Flavobacterium limnosediminis]ESU27331.1 putative haloacid dehalogenase-like hydrolase [Flavobacterium limnosediminis JC2902]